VHTTGATFVELFRITVLATPFAEGRPKLQFTESAHASLAAPVQTVSTFAVGSAEKTWLINANENRADVIFNFIIGEYEMLLIGANPYAPLLMERGEKSEKAERF